MKAKLVLGAVVLLAAAAAGAGWWWSENQGPTNEELEMLFEEDANMEAVQVNDIGNFLHEAPSELPEAPVNSEANQGDVINQDEVMETVIKPAETMTEVSISELGFTPEEVSAKVGSQTRFVNNGQGMHEPTQDNLEGFEAGVMQTGDSYTFTWDEAGEWLVSDKHNEDAKLRVVVE